MEAGDVPFKGPKGLWVEHIEHSMVLSARCRSGKQSKFLPLFPHVIVLCTVLWLSPQYHRRII